MFSSGSFWSGKGYFLQGLEAATVALRFRFQLDRNRDAMMTVYKLHLKQAAVQLHKTPHQYREHLGPITNVSVYGMAGWAPGRHGGQSSKTTPTHRNYDIIGLETGATSVMDVLEGVGVGVIRGVCNYADGQQSREWQPFAAAMAAALAKLLLYTIRPDGNLNRTKEQRDQSQRDIEKNPATARVVEFVLLPIPEISLTFLCAGFWTFLESLIEDGVRIVHVHRSTVCMV